MQPNAAHGSHQPICSLCSCNTVKHCALAAIETECLCNLNLAILTLFTSALPVLLMLCARVQLRISGDSSTTDAVCSCKTCSSRRLPVVRPEGQRPQSTAPYNCCRRQHLSGHGACCMKASGCCKMPPLFKCCTIPPASRCCAVPPLFKGCTRPPPSSLPTRR